MVTGAGFNRDGCAWLVASEADVPRLSRIDLERIGRRAEPLCSLSAGGASCRLCSRRRGLGPAVLPPDPPSTPGRPALHGLQAEDGLALSGCLRGGAGDGGAGEGNESGTRSDAQRLAARWDRGEGTAVFQPRFQARAGGIGVRADVPRSEGRARLLPADDHERRFAAITDVRATVDYLIDAGLAEPGRIGLSGRSYGGYLTLAALASFPELFQVGVDVCGISDFVTFFAHTEPWIAAAATTKYGDPETDTALRCLSPIHRVTGSPRPCPSGTEHTTRVQLGEARRWWPRLANMVRTVRSVSTTRVTRCAAGEQGGVRP